MPTAIRRLDLNACVGEWLKVHLSACTSVNKLLLFAGADAGARYVDDVTLTLLP